MKQFMGAIALTAFGFWVWLAVQALTAGRTHLEGLVAAFVVLIVAGSLAAFPNPRR